MKNLTTWARTSIVSSGRDCVKMDVGNVAHMHHKFASFSTADA